VLVGWLSMFFFKVENWGVYIHFPLSDVDDCAGVIAYAVHLREVWWTLAFGDFAVMDAFEEGEV
jgi:hypothetical protein